MLTSRTLTLALLIGLQGLVFSACIDGQNNVFQLVDASSNNVIQFNNIFAQTYSSNFQPSCYKNQANVKEPGKAQEFK
jgi:hypothetical protein